MLEPQQPQWPKREEEILAYWARERIFEQSVAREAPNGSFIFYEGPPTANAPPGLHHVEARTFKDVIPRYQMMRGKRVRRKAGWDTHGLPVELQIEKRIGLKTKREVEAHGIVKFNAACRDSVWEFKKDWERLTDRIGFWLDQRNPYITYAMPYVESVWWFLKQAWDKGLLTRDYKIVPWCPRCETPLSSHEVALGYEENVEDPSVTVRFVLTPESAARLRVSEGTAFLVWTTTPWTLPGNGALAVHPDGEYAVVRHGEARVILAHPLIARVLGEGAAVERAISGKELVGLRYQPLYERIDVAAYPEAYQTLDAGFVSFDDGTGIVHIAPAYGEDDFAFKARGIPPTFSVNEKGIMAEGLPGAGKFAKEADADIRADLRSRGLLFRDETTRHTYPFCWRCGTPLLYFARASWYIAMSKLRQEIQAKNATIHWFPDHIRDGRFGEWLRELKDWAITRERYWGAPMPIWECDQCGDREIIGSFPELIAKTSKRNRYLLMRHGEAESNARGVINAKQETSDQYPLTAAGRARVEAAAEQLKSAGITSIIASPYHRMRQTAEIVSRAIGVPVTYDERLREFDIPDFDGKPAPEYEAQFSDDPVQRQSERFEKKIGGNETWDELARRMLLALRDIDQRHEGETILICSHGDPLLLLTWAFSGRTREGISDLPYPSFDAPHEFAFAGYLVNDRGELDVHRPFIDTMTWECAKAGCGGTMRRFPEVVDVWLESGCMPFAQVHFPFEENGISNLKFEISNPPALYPADYISEAIDQTRGWFYTLLAVATVLGWEAPYRNVVVLGHLLDKHGKKMSKSKGNVVDPWAMIDRYGADIVRWYMLTANQPWDAKRFDAADLKVFANKPFGTLRNVLAFWELHGGGVAPAWSGAHVLDGWLRARFASLAHDVTQHLDAYEITEAARAIEVVVDDLSTWWLRRSRERLKAGDVDARATFAAALRSLAILLAPFAPFHAEHVWQALRGASSVHLAAWDDGVAPSADGDDALRAKMGTTRAAVRLVLEQRSASGIAVRQPLASVTLSSKYRDAFHDIVADEVNVKTVVIDQALGADDIRLDIAFTPELKREGMIRELTRAVNRMRKEMGLTPADRVRVTYHTDDVDLRAAIAERRAELERATAVVAWTAGAPEAPTSLAIGGATIALHVAR